MTIKTKFDYGIDFVLRWEVGLDKKTGKLRLDGGLNDDDGSWTKWGIRQAANPNVDVPNLSLSEAIEIYRSKYWNSYSLDNYEIGLSCAMFDSGVNCGPSRMVKWYEKTKAEKDPAYRLIEQRDIYYRELAKQDKYKLFLRGWLNRTADLKKYIDIIRLEYN